MRPPNLSPSRYTMPVGWHFTCTVTHHIYQHQEKKADQGGITTSVNLHHNQIKNPTPPHPQWTNTRGMHNNEKIPSECNGNGTWSIICKLSVSNLPEKCPVRNGTPQTTYTSSHRQRNQRRFCKQQYQTKEIKSNWYEILLGTRQSKTGTLSSVLGKSKGQLGRLFQKTSSNQTSTFHQRHISSPHSRLQ